MFLESLNQNLLKFKNINKELCINTKKTQIKLNIFFIENDWNNTD